MSPITALWAAPAILFAAMLIAWGAESAQFFIAQGFALAILAWLQTLPEFAVEAVLAWKQQQSLLLANLTGALRLLVGFAWPLIYLTAAVMYRKRHGKAMYRIAIDPHQSVEVAGLVLPILYAAFIWWKGSLSVWDGLILIGIYAAYLLLLSRMPPEDPESMDELDRIPRAVVRLAPTQRILAIGALFGLGGALIYFMAEPFLGSLLALSTAIGIPGFVFIQWVAPFVSEFPEIASTFYWARSVDKAPMALMNVVSSNINQWTLLTAMLPIVYSVSAGQVSTLVFDDQQKLELLMTVGQSLVGLLFLINMELAWWEAATIFGLFVIQFAFSAVTPGPGTIGYIATHIHEWVTVAYFAWAALEIVRVLMGRRKPQALTEFSNIWSKHIIRSAS